MKEEPPPPAISVAVERLPALLAGIREGGEVSLYEGLPDPFWEPEVRQQEIKGKKVTRVRGYPFYEEKRTLEQDAARQLTALLSASTSFAAYSGPKNVGEYNADFCISWKVGGGQTDALISVECAEVKLYGSQAELHCDLTPQATQQLKQLLEPYRKNRPVEESKP